MIVARIRLPAGLLPRLEKLRELKQTNKIAAYEVQNREVILYWRGMDAAGSIELALDAIATFPGRYTGESSVAYLYYTDELKSWVPGLPVTINAKA
jgi:alpha-2-macroglobulin-like protein